MFLIDRLIFLRAGRPALAALCLAVAGTAFADSFPARAASDGPWAATSPRQVMLLADSAPAVGGTSASAERKTRDKALVAGVDGPWYSSGNLHKYLGLASLASAALTIVSPKGYGGPHEAFAKAAAGFGGAAVVSGAVAHWDDIDFKWSDPDTKHAVLGLLGTIGYAVAIAQDGKGGHAGAGALGALSMAVAIKYTW